MLGCEWEVPPPIHEGLNVNMLQKSLDNALDKSLGSGKLESGEALVTYKGLTPATIWVAIMFVLWHV
jgi:hypothetical protein